MVDLLIVVIGISIAFCVEQHSKTTEKDEKRKLLLSSILSDIDEDINNFSTTQIPFNTYKSEELGQILKALEQNEWSDSILNKMEHIFVSVNTTLHIDAYESIKQSGNLNTIGNMGTVNAIVGYYGNTTVVDEIKAMNLQHLNKLTDYCAAKVELKISKDRYGLIKIKIPKSLSQDFRFKNLLKRWLIIIDYKISEYKRIHEEALHLKSQIEVDLSNV